MRRPDSSKSLQATPPDLPEILRRLRECLPVLAEEYGIASLGVFGSRIHDAARSDSDVDVLVEFHSTPTLFEFVRLQDELSQQLGAPVDLVMKSALKPEIGKRILAEVVPV